MIENIFCGTKLRLLEVFIEEETKSYPKYVNKDRTINKSGLGYIKDIKELITKEIEKKCPDGFDWCYVNSYGNAGALEHSITIYGGGKYFNWRKASISIDFCTCGNITCWGSINIISK